MDIPYWRDFRKGSNNRKLDTTSNLHKFARLRRLIARHSRKYRVLKSYPTRRQVCVFIFFIFVRSLLFFSPCLLLGGRPNVRTSPVAVRWATANSAYFTFNTTLPWSSLIETYPHPLPLCSRTDAIHGTDVLYPHNRSTITIFFFFFWTARVKFSSTVRKFSWLFRGRRRAPYTSITRSYIILCCR